MNGNKFNKQCLCEKGAREKPLPTKEDKARQLLWETSPELKELRQKFVCADVAHHQSLQMAEQRLKVQLSREESLSRRRHEQLKAQQHEEEEQLKRREEKRAQKEYHQVLDHLVQLKICPNDDEQLQEKAGIDAIRQKLEAEQLEQARERTEKQMEFRRQVQELQKEREKLRQDHKTKEELLDSQVDAYRRAQELRSQQQEEKRQLELEQRLRLQEDLLHYLERMHQEKLELEIVRTEVGVAEREAAEKRREEEDAEKKRLLRGELDQLYGMQMEIKKQREDLQKREEELYGQYLMEKLYKEDRLEMMSQQKRHQKKVEHMKAVQAVLAEGCRRREEEATRERADREFHEQLEGDRLRRVDEEKTLFLQKHAKDLSGYFPKGVFTDHKMADEFKRFCMQNNRQ